jgi:hypothetical protein
VVDRCLDEFEMAGLTWVKAARTAGVAYSCVLDARGDLAAAGSSPRGLETWSLKVQRGHQSERRNLDV